jgi:hypothetical protein
MIFQKNWHLFLELFCAEDAPKVQYMKHDNMLTYESLCWNVSCSALCDDALFIASYINGSLHMWYHGRMELKDVVWVL